MIFVLAIKCDNAAFEPVINDEVARILRVAAGRVGNDDDMTGSIKDANGNTVARFEVRESDNIHHLGFDAV